MNRLIICGCFLVSGTVQAGVVETCVDNAYAAIGAFEEYVDSEFNTGSQWKGVRCTRKDDGSFVMEMLANCGDDDFETVNTMNVTATTMPSKRCGAHPNKNAKCSVMIPASRHSIELFDQDFDDWMKELKSICELYEVLPPDPE